MNDLELLVIETLKELNEQEGLGISLDLNGGTALFGRERILDSLSLVKLIVALEQAIEDKFGASVSLADEKAMSQKKSPFRTIASLAEYAGRLIQGEV